MGEVTTFKAAGGLVSRTDLLQGLNNIATAAPAVGGEYQFLKMDKGNGEWLYGQEETVVEEGSLWAVNPLSLSYGYIAWSGDNDIEGEVMIPISRPLPAKDSLRAQTPDGKPSGKRGWQYQQSVILVCLTGEDEGTQVMYKQSSVGSQKLFAKLVNDISVQMGKGDTIVPIVELKSDSYKHEKWGRIYNPIFEVKDWRTMDDTTPPAEAAAPADDQADEEAELAAEYAAQQKAAAAPAAEAPRRRVRR